MSNAYKTIWTSEPLGQVVFRATSNAVDVNLQSSKVGGSTWKTEARMTRDAFTKAADALGMGSPYGGCSGALMDFLIQTQKPW